MSDTKHLRVHGDADPKGHGRLAEVRVDAARNIVEQLRRQEEQTKFEEMKARGITPEEIIAKGREDLDLPSRDEFDDDEFDVEEAPAKEDELNEEVEELKRQLKAEKTARTKAENKLKETDQVKTSPAQANQKTKDDEVKPMTPANTESKEEETK